MRKKKVKWRWDYGVYVPFCPYCNELAYEKDHCSFCLKPYKWVDKSKARKVVVGEYKVVQCSYKDIYIYKGEQWVMHMSCTKRKSKRQLKKMVDFYKMTTSDEWLNEAIVKEADDEQR